MSETFVCTICGTAHEGLPAMVSHHPDYWGHLADEQRAEGRLSEDLCKTADGLYFVRCVCILPLVGGPEPHVQLGVWGSLSEANFNRYVETFEDNDQSKLGEMTSWFSNEIVQFPGSRGLPAWVVPQDARQRPLIEIHESDHPLYWAQRNGIRYADALAIVHNESAPILPVDGLQRPGE